VDIVGMNHLWRIALRVNNTGIMWTEFNLQCLIST
jgi:hypothetical protein